MSATYLNNIKDKIKAEIIPIYKRIQDNGFEVFLVGGCVRDILLGKDHIKDWDFTTNATPQEIQKLFPDSFYDNKFGTVGIPFSKEKNNQDANEKNYLEITTYRKERAYKDMRHPEVIEWGKNLDEDLSRRDFTINAIAAKIHIAENKITGISLTDPFQGEKDIKTRIVRAVGNPYERFQEDALRLMRAIRFAAVLKFSIEEETLSAVSANAKLIEFVSFERIRDEMLKILESSYPEEGIRLLDNTGILDLIIPELTKGKGISQKRPGRHHEDDVFTHSLLSLKFTPSKDPIVRFASLIHDIGKSFVASKDEEGLITFYNHEVVGARLAKEISERFKLSKKQKEKIYTLVRWHMFTVDEKVTDSAIRRFIRRTGLENVKDIIDLRIGDRLGSGVKAESWRLRKFKERIEKELHPPFSINDLAVDGHDVMRQLNIKPGPLIGKILNKLFEEVDNDLSKNNKDNLIQRIKELGIEYIK